MGRILRRGETMADKIGKILYTKKDIRDMAERLGKQITKDYEGKELVVIGMLKGAFLWMAELIQHIDLDLKVDFVAASSYGSGTTSSGVVKIKQDISVNIYKKDILLVEDIVDTGTTLAYMQQYLQERSPASVKICTMLDKPSRRTEKGAHPDYIGETVDDLFIIGYGLDYDERYRNLPYISYLDESDVDKLK